MTVREAAATLELEIACTGDLDRRITGGYCGDLLSWVMSRAGQDNAWITIMCNLNTVAVAVLTDVSAVILADGVRPDDGVLKRAGEQGVTLLCSSRSAFELAGSLTRILEQGR